jgi:hypothetical protein
MKDNRKRFVFILIFGMGLIFIYSTFSNQLVTQIQIDQQIDIYKQINVPQNETLTFTNNASSLQTTHFITYPSIHECKNNYSVWNPHKIQKLDNNKLQNDKNFNYKNLDNSQKYHGLRISRAVSVYFPIDRAEDFITELKWLYRSWVYMQSYEPVKWRTDLVVFINYSQAVLNNETFSLLNDLNCTIKNQRTSDLEPPRCVLVDYVPLKSRQIKPVKDENKSIEYDHNYFLTKVDIFSNKSDDFILYFNYLIENTKTYANLDSVLIAFDGYDYFSKAKYDFVMRTGNLDLI